ncbi:hypothetical protein K443DRAFT_99252, partial [Laccaria amethystina LaAM-08-1]
DDLPGPFQDNFIRGSIFFFSQPAADLPIQPLVRLSNPKTPLGRGIFQRAPNKEQLVPDT